MHIHVAVDDPEKAIQVVNGAARRTSRSCSRSRRARRSGAASRPGSRRAGRWSSRPSRARGRRRASSDYADYAEVVGQLERTGCIADYTHIWWDIRLHPRLGTIEMRICDAVTRVEDAVAIAAYFQALVKRSASSTSAASEIPSYHRILTTENKWLAARYGLEAPVMDLATGRRNRSRSRSSSAARSASSSRTRASSARERELEGVREILARGNGADRQLRVWNANRDIVEVVREIADATEAAALPAVA